MTTVEQNGIIILDYLYTAVVRAEIFGGPTIRYLIENVDKQSEYYPEMLALLEKVLATYEEPK